VNGRPGHGPRTFTVSLQKVTGGAALGEISKVNVTIPATQNAAGALAQGSGAERTFAAE